MDLVEGLLGDAEELHLHEGHEERVVFGNRVAAVGRGMIHVDAQHLAEVGGEVLAGSEHVALPAAVAAADVQVAIRPEGDLAAVVVGVGAVDLHHDAGGLHVGAVGVGGGGLVLDDERGAVEPHVGVVDVELPVLLELRVELQVVEPLLQERAHDGVVDVHERLGQHLAILDDAHDARALAHEEAARAVRGHGHADGVHEVLGHLDEGDLGCLGQAPAGGCGVVGGRGRNGRGGHAREDRRDDGGLHGFGDDV